MIYFPRFWTVLQHKFKKTLKQPDRIFILPTPLGLSYGLLTIILLGISRTYTNTNLYIFTIMLVTLGVMAMIMTNNNLKDITGELTLEYLLMENTEAKIPLLLANSSADDKIGLFLNISTSSINGENTCKEVRSGTILEYNLPIKTNSIGMFPVSLLMAKSTYPLGLFKAWRNFISPSLIYIYPAPKGLPSTQVSDAAKNHTQQKHYTGAGNEDFEGLKPYKIGDSQKHVDWKAVARGRPLVVKSFTDPKQHTWKIRYEDTQQKNHHEKLQQLSLWLHQAHQAKVPFSLITPNNKILEDQGEIHFKACLKELAINA